MEKIRRSEEVEDKVGGVSRRRSARRTQPRLEKRSRRTPGEEVQKDQQDLLPLQRSICLMSPYCKGDGQRGPCSVIA